MFLHLKMIYFSANLNSLTCLVFRLNIHQKDNYKQIYTIKDTRTFMTPMIRCFKVYVISFKDVIYHEENNVNKSEAALSAKQPFVDRCS